MLLKTLIASTLFAVSVFFSISAKADVCSSTKYEFDKKIIWIFDIHGDDIEFNLRHRSDAGWDDYDFQINCTTKKYIDNKTGYIVNLSSEETLEKMIVTSCSKARIFNQAKPPACIDKSFSKTQVDNTAKISRTKKQCVDLGFKAGTEKFGKCVLELMK